MILESINRFKDLYLNIFNKGFFHLFVSNILVGIIGFGLQILIAKILSPVELGTVKTMQSFSMVGITLGGFGFNIAVLKLCSEPRNTSEKEHILKMNFMFIMSIYLLNYLVYIK